MNELRPEVVTDKVELDESCKRISFGPCIRDVPKAPLCHVVLQLSLLSSDALILKLYCLFGVIATIWTCDCGVIDECDY